jgi:Tfp pilus assembly protein PilN
MNLDLRIDFINRRRWPAAGLALAALALACLLWQGQLAWQDAQALTQQGTRLAQLQRQTNGPRASTQSPEAQRRLQQIEALAGYLATPWGPLLNVFESHASGRVVLLRFEPNAVEGRVEMGGRASDVATMSAYLVALERDKRLRDVMLRHHEATAADTATGVDFTLSASWAGTRAAAPGVTGAATAAAARATPPAKPTATAAAAPNRKPQP